MCSSVSGTGSRTSQNECDGVESNSSLAICLQRGFPQTEEPEKRIGEQFLFSRDPRERGEGNGQGGRVTESWYHMGNWAQFWWGPVRIVPLQGESGGVIDRLAMPSVEGLPSQVLITFGLLLTTGMWRKKALGQTSRDSEGT